MKKLILAILLITLNFSILVGRAQGREIEDIEQYNIPDAVFYEFIKNQNKYISTRKMKDVLRAVKYYNPRYFGKEGRRNYGLILVLSIMAQESSFRNINGDEGKSIGWMQIQYPTCDLAKKHNGIRKKVNLISRWGNIRCGSAELNRLDENLDGNMRMTIKAYNGGLDSQLEPQKWILSNRQTDTYYKYVTKKREKLLNYIREWLGPLEDFGIVEEYSI